MTCLPFNLLFLFELCDVYLKPEVYIAGKRWSTASAYLHPALSRPNLSVTEKTLVTKILFQGTKSIGVEYVKNGQTEKVRDFYFPV